MTALREWNCRVRVVIILLWAQRMMIFLYFRPRRDNVIAFWIQTKNVTEKFFCSLFFVLIPVVVELMNIYFLAFLEGNEENYDWPITSLSFWLVRKTALLLGKYKHLKCCYCSHRKKLRKFKFKKPLNNMKHG